MKQAVVYFILVMLAACSGNNSGTDGNNNNSTGSETGNDVAAPTGTVDQSQNTNTELTPNTSTNAAANEYLINGKITNAPNTPVFLDRYTISLQNNNLASTVTSADGSFSFKGNLPEKGLYLLRVNNNVNWLIVLDGGTLNFSADIKDIYRFKIEGSPESQVFAKFIEKAGENQLALNQINQRYNQAAATKQGQEMQNLQAQYTAKYKESQTFVRNFTDTVQFPLLAVFAASLMSVEENADYLNKFIAKAEKQLPGSSYVADLKEKISSTLQATQVANKLGIGQPAPDFSLKSPKGETLKLSGMKGKVVLLDFWASWCRPCRIENPNVVRLYDVYNKKGFEVFSVSLDKDMGRWVDAIKQDNLKWKYHGSNLKYWQEPVAQLYQVSSIPQTFLIDKDGKIIAKNLRGEQLEQKLKEIFGS